MASAVFDINGHRVSKIDPPLPISISPWNSKHDSHSHLRKLGFKATPFNLDNEQGISEFVNNLPEIKTSRKNAHLKSFNKEKEKVTAEPKPINPSQTERGRIKSAKKGESVGVRNRRSQQKERASTLRKTTQKSSRLIENQAEAETGRKSEQKRECDSLMNFSLDITKNLRFETQELINAIKSSKLSQNSSSERVELREAKLNSNIPTMKSIELKMPATPSQTNILQQSNEDDENSLKQKISSSGVKRIRDRNSSKIAIESLLVKKNIGISKNSRTTIKWCAALEAFNALSPSSCYGGDRKKARANGERLGDRCTLNNILLR